MALFIDGIKIGLVLCLMVGPLFFTLVQTGVEEGLRAGTMVGLGIWMSDLLYIFAVYGGMSYLSQFTARDHFSTTVGIAGSAVLTLFGLVALMTVPKNLYVQDDALALRAHPPTSYLSLWLKGFLINTINPFTIFFWMGLMSTVIVRDDLSRSDALLFFGGIMGMVVSGDFLKVFMAKRIRAVLRPVHLLWLRKVSGAALIVFGIALLLRVLL
ncbi:MAG: LysE family translocator [Haliscomenobacter sp.]|nr:LysE family translocator [Haliscomenobacter sp.]